MNQPAAVRCTAEGPVLTVTLSRPAQRNAVDGKYEHEGPVPKRGD